MATTQFKSDSPYIGRDDRKHDSSDVRYQKFVEATSVGDASVSRTVSIALIGVGRAGSIHLNSLVGNSNVDLVYVIESDKSKWGKIGNVCGSTTTLLQPADLQKALSDSSLDAVVICTPTFTHKDIILEALQAGKAVFSEKPIGKTPSDTKACYEAANSADLPLFCGFQRRWDPTFSDIQDRVRKGEAGHVQIIKSISRDSPLPSMDYLKISGGIYHDCMVHDIDMITWVLGELPNQVYTVANAQIPEIAEINDHDNVVTTLQFPSGTIGIINVNRFACYGYDQRLEVFGMKAMLEAENGRPNTAIHSSTTGSHSVPIFHSFPSRYEESYAAEMECFLDVIRGREELPITYRNSAAVSKIADAAESSARSNFPVKITWQKAEVPTGYHT